MSAPRAIPGEAVLGIRGSLYADAPARCGGCGRRGRWIVDVQIPWCPRCGGRELPDGPAEGIRYSEPLVVDDACSGVYAPGTVLCTVEDLDSSGEVVDRYVSVAPAALTAVPVWAQS